MNKTKRWLLTYISVILVLILGILASQVQANQQSSDTSVEEVKNVIRNYFDIRYQTLSTLDPQNISDFFENVDLQAPSTITELEKLEIERHHVKLNHLRFLQFK